MPIIKGSYIGGNIWKVTMRSKRWSCHLWELLASIDVSENGFFQTREMSWSLL